MRLRALIGGTVLAAAILLPQVASAQQWPVPGPGAQQLPVPRHGVAPKGPLNTLTDIRDAIIGCWKWPPLSEVHQGMELTIRLSFKSSGEMFGAKLTYQTRDVSDDERRLYYGVLLEALKLCSPLPVSESLGGAIAGRPFTFRFKDTRKEGKA
jgi:hypothetical protein